MNHSTPFVEELEHIRWQSELDAGDTLHFAPGLIVWEQPGRARADVYLDASRDPSENDLTKAFVRNAYGPVYTGSKVFIAAHTQFSPRREPSRPLHIVVHLPSGDVRRAEPADGSWPELRQRFLAMAFNEEGLTGDGRPSA
jgi:hypothetical protein